MRCAATTLHKKRLSTKDFFSKCEQIRSFLWIWSHLLKKSLMENLIFCAVPIIFNSLELYNLIFIIVSDI